MLDGKIDISSVNFSGNLKMCFVETLGSSYIGIVAFKYAAIQCDTTERNWQKFRHKNTEPKFCLNYPAPG